MLGNNYETNKYKRKNPTNINRKNIKKGYDNVSIRSIARDVGIKESSIYNHYKNKEDILDKILKKFLDILEETSLESSDLKKI